MNSQAFVHKDENLGVHFKGQMNLLLPTLRQLHIIKALNMTQQQQTHGREGDDSGKVLKVNQQLFFLHDRHEVETVSL